MLEISGVLLREGSNLRVELHCLAPVSMIFIVALSLVRSPLWPLSTILGIFSTLIAARIIHIVSTVMQLHVTPAPCVAFYIQQKGLFFQGGKKLLRGQGAARFYMGITQDIT